MFGAGPHAAPPNPAATQPPVFDMATGLFLPVYKACPHSWAVLAFGDGMGYLIDESAGCGGILDGASCGRVLEGCFGCLL
ncbi:hypothetical protein SDC9_16437 [bioreactor metagenome]|uniref:Uncharacterized protein n=1 Tax=bioreactor metagenome TaxID=1076179 RepID=A0A644TW70_9ZZZZ